MNREKVFLFILFTCFTASSAARGDESEMIYACGDDRVLMIDAASSTEEAEIVWEWRTAESGGLPESYRSVMLTNDDCKPVEGGSKILVTSSGGGVVLVNRKSGDSLFYALVPNAHSAEYLPGGRIVVALSTAQEGNSLELYDEKMPEEVLFRDSLYSGHGVVWIEERRRLFALGGRELRSYSLENWDSQKPGLKLEQSWNLPDEGGHDLSLVSPEMLLLTTHNNVWEFDVAEEVFSVFEPLEGAKDVKSVNFDPQRGRLIYTKAEESWWTENIYLRNPDKVISIPGMKLYKVRFAD